jgi:hypothetical protein
VAWTRAAAGPKGEERERERVVCDYVIVYPHVSVF